MQRIYCRGAKTDFGQRKLDRPQALLSR
jgi:hypothetical protein